MRIISAKPKKSVLKRATCEYCGALLEYVPADVKEYHGKDYSGGPDGREWIVCANCNHDITIRSW